MSKSQHSFALRASEAKEKNKKIYQREVKRLIEILKFYRPERIILFGSATSGKIHRDSDVDVCIIKKFKNSVLEEKKKLFGLLWKHNFNYLFDPDIKLYHPSKFRKELQKGDPFLEEIVKGKVIYEKE